MTEGHVILFKESLIYDKQVCLDDNNSGSRTKVNRCKPHRAAVPTVTTINEI